ncbi:DUF421 domain-containing protein [Neobacillus niacini]|uniref:DUF421 domain-containing protein n=1 Tax=Neobacillus niacini TaxID=86668 RepID=UPI003B01E12C
MSITFIWESIILLFISTILLRIAGKKSVAQMSSLEIIITLAIGTTMGHAIREHTFWQVLVILTIFVLYLIFVQFLQLKLNFLKRYLTGNTTVVIRNGQIIVDSLKKLRMTTDQLEMKLRQKGIAYICDVKTATIESDGGLGYELMEHIQPITRKEFLQMNMEYRNDNLHSSEENKQGNLFNKIPDIK